jgi:hypothetical protein
VFFAALRADNCIERSKAGHGLIACGLEIVPTHLTAEGHTTPNGKYMLFVSRKREVLIKHANALFTYSIDVTILYDFSMVVGL